MLFGGLAYLGRFLPPAFDPSFRLAGTAVLAVVLAMHEFGLVRLPLPRNHHSVPQWWWFDFGPNQASFAYGLILGFGVTTVVPFGTFYLVIALALVAADLEYGLALGSTYGLARALPVLGASLIMASHRDRGRMFQVGGDLALRINGGRRVAHLLNGLAAAGFAAASIVALSIYQ